MKKINTVDAVGHVLCHDVTRIVKDEFKGVAFKKGHVVRPEDVETLLSMGKEQLYIWERAEGMLHEDEAVQVLLDICKNENMVASEVREGKIELTAQCDGLFRVDTQRLEAINSFGEMMIATRHTNYPVKKGDKLAGTRIIPLIIEEAKMNRAKESAGDKPLLELLPYRKLKVGIVTTGSEVYHGRIKDTFTPVIISKLAMYGLEATGHKIVDDNKQNIMNAVSQLKAEGSELIVCTGGMSVDPDDMTPSAIRECGAEIVTYGVPVLPGAMFLLAYFEDGTPVLGLPGCVMYAKTTIFDLVLPRIAAGVTITRRELAGMGHGGLCLCCDECHYPLCGFGKGV